MSKRISATIAKNRFGDVLKMAEAEPVYIVKHGKPQAVVVSSTAFEALLRKARDPQDLLLGTLRDEFDALCLSMQTKRWRKGAEELLAAPADNLNRSDARKVRKPRA